MEILFVANRMVSGAGYADGAVPGPVTWGIATCMADQDAEEGWGWTPGAAGLRALKTAAFLKELKKRLAPKPGGPRKALLLHAHGAGCLTKDAFCRAANLARIYGGDDLEIVPVLLSWACGGFNVGDYIDARHWMQRDVAEFAEAFRVVAKAAADRPAGTLAFITAHSLGHQLLARILADCAMRPGGEPAEAEMPFDDALLFAGDVDDNALDAADPPPGSGLHRLDRWVREIHVYCSPADALVGLSFIGDPFVRIPDRSGPALGSGGPRPAMRRTARGTPVNTVNCGFLHGATRPPAQHHYWRVDPLAVGDVRAVLRQAPPSAFTWRTRNIFSPVWDILPGHH